MAPPTSHEATKESQALFRSSRGRFPMSPPATQIMDALRSNPRRTEEVRPPRLEGPSGFILTSQPSLLRRPRSGLERAKPCALLIDPMCEQMLAPRKVLKGCSGTASRLAVAHIRRSLHEVRGHANASVSGHMRNPRPEKLPAEVRHKVARVEILPPLVR